jgi:glycerate kinase
MRKKILITPNSFKECADSVQVSEYLAEYLAHHNLNLILKPISDGGDGFLNVCKMHYNLEILRYRISTPYDESKFICEVGYNKPNETIYIESANALGLKIIPLRKRHPAVLSSKGMGDLLAGIIKDVQKQKIRVKKLIIGIGGTGTNDLGLGMCARFGLKLFDASGKELNIIPKNFRFVSRIVWSKFKLPFSIEVVLDVINPLLGKSGATYVFGVQKGLTRREITEIENGFINIVNLLKNNKILNTPEELPGAGGGLASGLKIFLNSKMKQSKYFVLYELKIGRVKRIHSIILTEGAFDKQSLMGKATGCLMEHFARLNTNIILCSGRVESSIKKYIPKNVRIIELRKYFRTEKESIKNFRKGIKFASEEILKIVNE